MVKPNPTLGDKTSLVGGKWLFQVSIWKSWRIIAHDSYFFRRLTTHEKTPNITFESTKSHLWSESHCLVNVVLSHMLSCFRYIVGGEFFTHLRKVWLLLNGVATLQQLGRVKKRKPPGSVHTSFSHVWMMRKIWWRFLYLFTMFDVELGTPATHNSDSGRPAALKMSSPSSTQHRSLAFSSAQLSGLDGNPIASNLWIFIQTEIWLKLGLFFARFSMIFVTSFPLKLAQLHTLGAGAGAASDQPISTGTVMSWTLCTVTSSQRTSWSMRTAGKPKTTGRWFVGLGGVTQQPRSPRRDGKIGVWSLIALTQERLKRRHIWKTSDFDFRHC